MANRQVYQLTARTLALTDVIPTQDAAGSLEAGKNTIQDVANLVLPYKEAILLITQTGTSNPTITEVYNNTGKTFTGSRGLAGYYYLLVASPFANADKVLVEMLTDGLGREYSAAVPSTNTISFIAASFGTNLDDLLTKTRMIIRVYN